MHILGVLLGLYLIKSCAATPLEADLKLPARLESNYHKSPTRKYILN
jgi:hypothetical protein